MGKRLKVWQHKIGRVGFIGTRRFLDCAPAMILTSRVHTVISSKVKAAFYRRNEVEKSLYSPSPIHLIKVILPVKVRPS